MDRRLWWFLGAGLVVTLIVAGVLSGYASGEPDGLERVSIDEGFEDSAQDHSLDNSPLADYAVEGIENDQVSTGIAGIIGVVVTLVVATGLFYGLRYLGQRRAAEE
jgi:ABC-type glucose/galactose transport system permease subunit